MTQSEMYEILAAMTERCKVSETPWDVIQFLDALGTWRMCTRCPSFSRNLKYRIKPRTITVNGIEVPEPLRVAPEQGTDYFVPNFCFGGRYTTRLTCHRDQVDFALLRHGMCHSTPEAATAHAKAIIAASGGEVDV